jgi:antitoxin ParD1/3/4
MPRSYALGDHFERFIDDQVKSGRYNNASEVVRAALRVLEDGERERRLVTDELARLVQAGADSGPGRPAEAVFAGLRAKIAATGETDASR